MSILAYPQHQFVIEISNDEITNIMNFQLSLSGYLRHICVKMIRRNYSSSNGRARLLVLQDASHGVVSQSDWVNYSEIEKADNPEDFYHTKIRFDFPDTGLTTGVNYLLAIYQEDYEGSLAEYIGYCLDYNFPVNETSLPNHPFDNSRLAAEIFLMRDYYDFN